jgi:hypothetical protein
VIALVVLGMALLEKQMGLWAFAPVLVGGLGLLSYWRAGPLALLLALCVAILAYSRGIRPEGLFAWLIHGGVRGTPAELPLDPLPDLVACAATVAYVAAHYRLQATERSIFPYEPRRRSLSWRYNTAELEPPRPRSARLLAPLEIGLLAATLPLWAGLAALLLYWLVQLAPELYLVDEPWRMPTLLLWGLGLSLAVPGAVLGYRRWRAASPEAALTYLQDVVWRETRRDQGRLHHWSEWAQLRAGRRKERS